MSHFILNAKKSKKPKNRPNKKSRIVSDVIRKDAIETQTRSKPKTIKYIFWGLMGIVTTTFVWVGGLNDVNQFWNNIKDFGKSDNEIKIEGKFINGIVSPFNIYDTIRVYLSNGGGGSILTRNSKNDLLFEDAIMYGCRSKDGKYQDFPINFRLKIQHNLLFISSVFRDFKTNEVIGELLNNVWKVDHNKSLNYYSDEKSFEVIDNQGNAIFQMWLNDEGRIHIRGYFVGKYCTYFLTDLGLKVAMYDEDKYLSELYKEYSIINKPRFIKSLLPR